VPAQVLVTGGAGFIGSHLTERLLRDGKSVVVIDDLSTGRLENLATVNGHPALKVIQGKVSEVPDLKDIVSRSESIYHLAAAVGVELVMQSQVHTNQTNLRETEVILEAASRCQTPLLLTSTSEVYGKSQKDCFTEEDDLVIGPPHLSRWSYACSKLMDEFLAFAFAREHHVPVIVARLFNTVGPRQTGRYGMVLPRFIAAAKAGKPLKVYGTGDQTRCFCFVQDTVEALVRLQASLTARGRVFNVGTDREISIVDLARLVKKIARSESPIELVPYTSAFGPGFEDILRRRPAISRLEQTVGFRPATPIEEIVRRTL
jgi:UDP-glucose 4-epimerase